MNENEKKLKNDILSEEEDISWSLAKEKRAADDNKDDSEDRKTPPVRKRPVIIVAASLAAVILVAIIIALILTLGGNNSSNSVGNSNNAGENSGGNSGNSNGNSGNSDGNSGNSNGNSGNSNGNSGNSGDSHVHSFGNWIIVNAPTCTEEGEEKGLCQCGEEENRTVKPLGHTEVIDDAIVPTCTVPGLTEGIHCSVCNHIIKEQTSVPATGHIFINGICTKCSEGATRIFMN